jgi:diaminopimelate epimerase
MKLYFAKMCASGNDFVIIDNRSKVLTKNLKKFAQQVCQRRWGIGADGLILVEKSQEANFKMRFFNPDGSEVEMCGNGARSVALFAYLWRIAPQKMEFETKAGKITAEVGKRIKVKLTSPKKIALNCLRVGKNSLHYIDTGVPHVVIFKDKLDKIDVVKEGSEIRYHSFFQPSGTNVDFVSLTSAQALRVRTYERGVEDETLACGTGVVASALVTACLKKSQSPLKVLTQGGEVLKVYFKLSPPASFSEVYLEGKASLVYKGEVENGSKITRSSSRS